MGLTEEVFKVRGQGRGRSEASGDMHFDGVALRLSCLSTICGRKWFAHCKQNPNLE